MSARYTYHLALALPAADSQRLSLILREKTHTPHHPSISQPKDHAANSHALIIAELAESNLPHPFLRQRLTAALPEILPAAFPIQTSRITAINQRAALTHLTPTCLRDLTHFLAALTPYLGAQNIPAAAIRPHIPLPFAAHAKTAIPQIFGWTAESLILSEYDQFTDQQRIVKSWPLPPPIQGSFLFPIAA